MLVEIVFSNVSKDRWNFILSFGYFCGGVLPREMKVNQIQHVTQCKPMNILHFLSDTFDIHHFFFA